MRAWYILPLLIGCGPDFEPRAFVRGPFVKVSSNDFQLGDMVTVKGISATVPQDFVNFAVEVPAEALGAGRHLVEVHVDRGGSTSTRTVDVLITEKNVAPQVRIGPCESGKSAEKRELSVTFTSDVWLYGFDQTEDRCRIPNGQFTAPVTANADARVTIAGEPIALDGGHGVWSELPMHTLGASVTLDMLGPGGRRNWTATLPVEVERPSGSASFEVQVAAPIANVVEALRKQLVALEPGQPVPWTSTPNDGAPRVIAMVTKEATATVGGEERKKVAPGFWGIRAIGPAGATLGEIDLFAVATPVDVTRNGSCAYKAMPGSPSLANEVHSISLDVMVVNAAGDEVAQRRFDAPAKARCPRSITGEQGKTVAIWSGPRDTDVMTWLNSVGNGKQQNAPEQQRESLQSSLGGL